MTDVDITVFGCADTDWAATYRVVPKLLDAGLDTHGGTRIHPRDALHQIHTAQAAGSAEQAADWPAGLRREHR